MAEIYYKYADNNASSQINWGEIGKNLVDMLHNEQKIRDDKKAAIDQASRDFGKELADAPTGQSEALRRWALTYADDAQSARLLQDRLLKSGQLKLKDYNIMRQNITDGTQQAFSLAKDYQAVYADKMDRKNKGIASEAELQMMAMAESFGKFDENKLLINPTDFTVSVGKMVMGPDGVPVLSKNKNDYQSVGALKNIITSNIDKFDLNGAAKIAVDQLGSVTQAVIKSTGSLSGFVESITSPELAKQKLNAAGVKAVDQFNVTLDKTADAILASPQAQLSTMIDYMPPDPKTGQRYQVTFDPNEAKKDSHWILMNKANPTQPIFTAEQNKAAKEYTKQNIISKISETQKIEPFNKTQWREDYNPYAEANKKLIEDSLNIGKQVKLSVASDNKGGIAGTEYLRGKGMETTKNLDANGKLISITYTNTNTGNSKTFTPTEVEKYGATVAGFFKDELGAEENAFIKGYKEQKGSNTFNTTYRPKYTPPAETADLDVVEADFKPYQAKALKTLVPKMQRLGIKVEGSGFGGETIGTNKVTFKSPIKGIDDLELDTNAGVSEQASNLSALKEWYRTIQEAKAKQGTPTGGTTGGGGNKAPR
jgi:hypothetical protein